jgi:NADH:ubiquinone oxidoreductase subunit C
MKLIRYLLDVVPYMISSIKISLTGHVFINVDFVNLQKFMFFLCKHTFLHFTTLIDYVCLDYIQSNFIQRFFLVICLLNFTSNERVFINYTISGSVSESLVWLFFGVAWLEREIWDLFGISFLGHCDMRRILTDYGFSSFPLRKDFPVTGFVESRYNDMFKRIVILNLSLVQEFRNFEVINPWVAL